MTVIKVFILVFAYHPLICNIPFLKMYALHLSSCVLEVHSKKEVPSFSSPVPSQN
jgi:hypothetical protein